jgi:hypothetical protein
MLKKKKTAHQRAVREKKPPSEQPRLPVESCCVLRENTHHHQTTRRLLVVEDSSSEALFRRRLAACEAGYRSALRIATEEEYVDSLLRRTNEQRAQALLDYIMADDDAAIAGGSVIGFLSPTATQQQSPAPRIIPSPDISVPVDLMSRAELRNASSSIERGTPPRAGNGKSEKSYSNCSPESPGLSVSPHPVANRLMSRQILLQNITPEKAAAEAIITDVDAADQYHRAAHVAHCNSDEEHALNLFISDCPMITRPGENDKRLKDSDDLREQEVGANASLTLKKTGTSDCGNHSTMRIRGDGDDELDCPSKSNLPIIPRFDGNFFHQPPLQLYSHTDELFDFIQRTVVGNHKTMSSSSFSKVAVLPTDENEQFVLWVSRLNCFSGLTTTCVSEYGDSVVRAAEEVMIDELAQDLILGCLADKRLAR